MRGMARSVKFSIIFGIVLFLCSLSVQTVYAEEHTVIKEYEAGSDITATLYSDGLLELTGTGATYSWSTTSVPWVEERADIVSVTLGEGITQIGDYAFYGCTGLETAPIPETTQKIGYRAFYGCTSLAEVNLAEGLTEIANQAFYNCSAIEEMVIPSTLVSLGGNQVFGGCTGLTKITFAYGMTKIPNNMCYGLSALTTVVYETGVPEAAEGEEEVTEEETSVTEIGENAFYGCTGLATAPVPATLQKIGYRAFYGCTGLASLVCGNEITEIGERAFYNCSGLETVTFNEGLKTIKNNAFANCTSLTQIKVPSTLGTASAFSGCTGITKVTFSYGMTKVPDYMCQGMSGLTTVVFETGIPEAAEGEEAVTEEETSITEIGNYAFSGCSALTAMPSLENLEIMGYRVFYNCSSLETVDLNEGLTKIGDRAFYNCTSLTEIKVPSTLKAVGSDTVFGGCTNLTKVTFAYGMTKIPDYMCYGMNTLTTLIFEAKIVDEVEETSITEIGQRAFYGCSALTEMPELEKLEIIGGSAFYNCSALEEVILNEGLTTIGGNAFSKCTSLSEIRIPSTLESGDYGGVFDGCTNLTTVIFAYGMTRVPDYICYNAKALTTIVFETGIPEATEGEEEITEEETSITEIGECAFYGCSALTETPVLENLETICYRAFYNCSLLEEVNLNEGIKTLESSAFEKCVALTEVRLPSTLENVGGYGIFAGCTSLTKVTFGHGMTKIPGYVCYGMNALTEIVYEEGDPETEETIVITEIGEKAFYGCSALPAINLNEGLTTIGSDAFYNCTSLTEVRIPSTLETVGYGGIFEDCDNLTKVTFAYGMTKIPDYVCYCANGLTTVEYETQVPETEGEETESVATSSITEIGDYAFYECTSLVQVTIPENVVEIGYGAYEYCSNLDILYVSDTLQYIGDDAFGVSSKQDIIINTDNEFLRSIDWEGDHNRNPLFPEKTYAAGDNVGVKLYADGLLLIDGFGPMADFEEDTVPWKEDIANINSVIIAPRVTGIGCYALAGTNISYIDIGDSVTQIGAYAFKNCDSLVGITIGNGVEAIGAGAFYVADSFDTKVTSSNQVALDYYWTDDNRVLNDQIIVYDISRYIKAYLCDGELRIAGRGYMSDYSSGTVPWKAESLKKVIVCEGIKSVGAYSFYKQAGLETVKLPQSLASIGKYAFNGCTSLIEADLSEKVTLIGNYAFMGCSSLVKVTLENTEIMQVPTACFSGCSSLRKIKFPTTVTVIATEAFKDCVALGDLELHEGIREIGSGAFWNCDKLTTIKIPRSLRSVGRSNYKGPFADCDNLTSATFGAKTRAIPDYLFGGCIALEKVVLQDTITEIGDYGFYNCTSLINMELSERMTIIGYGAFYGCTALEEVVWNDDLQTIEAYAFYNCSKLSNVEFTELFTVVNDYTFYGTALKEVVLPYNVNSIKNNAFACDTLTTISIPAQTKSINSNAFGSLTELIIVGARGSAAEEFADEKGFTFVDGTAASEIYISEEQVQLSVDETYELSVEVEPMDAVDEIIWTSSNEDIVSVSPKSGDATKVVIEALEAGNVQVVVSVGSMSAVCHVSVGNYVQELELSDEYLYFDTIPGQIQLEAEVYPEDAENAQLVWTTSDKNVAIVDQTGLVTAVGNGMARLVVKTADNSMQKTCFVNVDAVVSVDRVVMQRKEVFISRGQKQLTATVYPLNATNQHLVWSSSNEAIVTVDENGLITAVSDGQAVITAQVAGGSMADTCIVTVQAVEVPVTGVTISQNSIMLDDVTRSMQLTASVVPENASVQDIYWSSSDSTVATVDETGKVYAQSGGVAEIVALTKDGDFRAKCTVTVTELVRKLEIAPLEVWLKAGQSADLTATFTPASKLDVEKEWYSTNTNIATVDQTGKVYAVANGETYIKCHTLDGSDLLAACKVYVGEGYISISSIGLSHTSMNLFIGESAKLTAAVAPANATRPALSYASNNPQVAQVSADGVITAVQKGSATITVSSVYEPGQVAYCVVTVSEQSQQVSKDPQQGVSKEEAAYNPGKVNLKSVKAGKKQITVKWGKKSGDGYQIQYSTKKNFKSKKTVTVKSSKKVSTTIKKLKSKKTYYVRVRSYKKINGKTYYGSWSKVKKVKVK